LNNKSFQHTGDNNNFRNTAGISGLFIWEFSPYIMYGFTYKEYFIINIENCAKLRSEYVVVIRS
jgi:hypothetical protein